MTSNTKPAKRAPARAQRLLLVAAIAAALPVSASANGAAHERILPLADVRHTGIAPTRRVLFVDERVPEPEIFVHAVASEAQIVRIDASRDGLTQIAEYLDLHAGVGTAAIVAHGAPGQLQIGSSLLDGNALAAHAPQLARIGRTLARDADILLYSCDTAAGESGLNFVQRFARLTGHAVAASNNVTGANGDWDLEIVAGNLHAVPMLSASVMKGYAHDLATLVVTNTADAGAGTLRNAIAAAAAGDTIIFNTTGTLITLTSGELVINKSLTIEGDIDSNGTPDITIDANYSSRVLHVTAGTVKLDGLVIRHGVLAGVGGSQGGTAGSSYGAGINNAGILTLSNDTITTNYASGGGGGPAAGPDVGGGGGGGSGAGGKGGAAGGSTGSGTGSYAGQAGIGSAGGNGGSYDGVYLNGRGGSNAGGGAGGSAGIAGYIPGGVGGLATNGVFTIGGGGGGAGWAGNGIGGGNAAGGIFNSGTLFVIGNSAITNNGAAGGGGAGGDNGGAGGNAVGGIWNTPAGTLKITPAAFTAMTGNAAGGGIGGSHQPGGSTGSTGNAYPKINLGTGAIDTAYNPDVAPVVSTSGGTTAFVEGNNVASTPVVIDSGVITTDVDNTTFASGKVSITGNFHAAEDLLAFTSNPGTMGNIGGSYNSASGVLTLTSTGATATTAQWQAAFRSVTYTDSSDTPNTTVRTISFVVNDGALDSNTATKSVSVAATDDTPIVTTSGGNTAFTEGNNVTSTPVVVDSGVTVADTDNATLASATVSITGGLQSGEDILAFTNNPATMGNISATYTSGVLALSSAGASATLAQWQAALRAVTYTDTSDSPNTGNRTISFTANDGTATGNMATKTVTVASVNDAPVVTTSGGTTAATEQVPATVDIGITVSDLDNATLASATASITANLHTGEDVLAFSNNPVTMGNVSASYSSGTGVLTLTSTGATATTAQWQAALRSVTYTDTSDAPNTASRTISFIVNDGSIDSAAATKTVSVSSVNDAPVVTTSGGTTAASEQVAAIVDSGLFVTDPDSATLASATVAITGNLHGGEDVLAFTNNPATMGNISASYNSGTGVLTLSSAGATATTAQWQAALRSVTYIDTSDAPNTGNRTLSFTVNDGSLDSNVATKTVSVAAVNDAPVVTTSGAKTTFTEGNDTTSIPVAIDGALTVTDADSATLASATVSITGGLQSGEDTLAFANDGGTMGNVGASYDSLTGVLTLTSAGATATTAQWQSALRAVTYSNTSDTPNTANRTISFAANDGTSNGSAANKIVQVVSVNDTPIVTTSAGSTPALAQVAVVVDAAITATDVDSATFASGSATVTGNFQAGEDVLVFTNNPATMGNISASYNSATGVLTLNSAGATATKAQWQAALAAVTYTDTSATPNTTIRTVSFVVNDGNSASAPATKAVSLRALPVVTTSLAALVATEQVAIAIDNGVTASDSASATLATVTVAITGNFQAGEDLLAFVNDGSTMGNIAGSYDGATGVLQLTSAGASATLAQWQAALRAVTYTDTSDVPDTGSRTIGFVAYDGVGTSATASRTITVTAVDDAPVNHVPGAQATPQDVTLTFNPGNGNLVSVTDVDGGAGTEEVTLTSTHGTLSLSGTTGLTFFVGSGAGDVTMTFSGTLADINIALSGLVFTPTPGYFGAASIQITSNDLGNTGSGGTQTDTDTISIVVIAPTPSVTNVSSTTANGTYKAGDALQITITFDQPVIATGTPTLLLETGTIDHQATYTSGSGTNTLTFTYTVQAGDNSADLDYASKSALSLNGGTIRNTSASDAALVLPTMGAAGSLGANKDLVLDGIAPAVTSVGVPANATYIAGQNLDFTVQFGEAVVVTGTPKLAVTLDTGGVVAANYVSGSGTNTLTFRYVVQNGNADANGIVLGSSIAANGGTLRDAAGNDAALALNGVASTTGVLVDAIGPAATAITLVGSPPANAATISFNVTFSEPVTGVDASDFTLTKTGTAAGAIASVSGSGSSYVVTVTGVGGIGTLRLDLDASGTGIADSATNALAGGFTAGSVFNVDVITSFSGPTATGAGIATISFTGGGSNCGFTSVALVAAPGNVPTYVAFPDGLFSFTVSGCTPGATLAFHITYPQALPGGAQYWKYGPTAGNTAAHWYVFPATIAGSDVTFNITDGGAGDDDLNATNGIIVDPSGAGVNAPPDPVPAPVLSPAWLAWLAGLLAVATGWFRARRAGGR